MTLFKKLLFLLPILITTLAATGCSDDVTDPDDDAHVHAHARILFYNGAADQASLNLVVDGVVIAIRESMVLNENYAELEAGELPIQLTATGSADPIVEGTFTFVKDAYYSVFAHEDAAGTLNALVVSDDLTTPAEGKAHIRLVNLSPDAPKLKGAVPGSQMGAIFNNVESGGISGAFQELTAGEYSFRIQDAAVTGGGGGGGSTGLIPDTTITLEAGTIYTLAFVGSIENETAELILIEHEPEVTE